MCKMWKGPKNRNLNNNRHFDMDFNFGICNCSEHNSIQLKTKILEVNKQKILLNFIQIRIRLIRYFTKDGYI